MRPFCNKGWPYLQKFESILPQSGAKGKHAYAPASANPTPLHGDDTDPEMMNENKAVVGWADAMQGGENSGEMDVDGASMVASGSKHSFPVASLDDHGSLTTAPPSTLASHSSEPLRKKWSSAPSSAVSTCTSSVTSHMSASTATKWSWRSSSTKITSAVAINSMQGSINQLTDVFEKAMTTPLDTVGMKQDKALQVLQTQDADSLNCMQIRKIIDIFTVNPAFVVTYIALGNDEIQWDWLHGLQMLRDWDNESRPAGPLST